MHPLYSTAKNYEPNTFQRVYIVKCIIHIKWGSNKHGPRTLLHPKFMYIKENRRCNLRLLNFWLPTVFFFFFFTRGVHASLVPMRKSPKVKKLYQARIYKVFKNFVSTVFILSIFFLMAYNVLIVKERAFCVSESNYTIEGGSL